MARENFGSSYQLPLLLLILYLTLSTYSYSFVHIKIHSGAVVCNMPDEAGLVTLLPSSGQTLALAEPEARLYNHLPTRPPAGANVCIGYISAISQRNELKFCMIVI